MSEHHGVVYTKDWVVGLILDIAGYTNEKRLWDAIVVEPSCGHGSFLKEIVHRLLITAQRDHMLDKETLMKCVNSFDLDAESVSICREIAAEELCVFGVSKFDANEIAEEWIKCDDYLLHDTIPADYVIGNPPYLRASDIPADSREKYVSQLSTMTKGCDIFVGFFQKGLESLRNTNGVLCYICADRWMQNQYGRNLRGLISDKYHIDTFIRMHDVDAFETEVSAYPAITRIDFGTGDIKYVDCNSSFSSDNVTELKKWLNRTNQDYKSTFFSAALLEQPKGSRIVPLSEPQTVKNIVRLIEKFPTLEDSGVKIGIGLATGRDDVYIVDDPDTVEADRMLPMFNMREWRRKKCSDSSWLVNPWDRDGSLVRLTDYPRLQSYYEKHREEIAKRHVAKKNSDGWYRTIDKVNWSIVGIPMLLFPDMAMTADPVYSDGKRYPCHNCYWLVSDSWDIKVLGGLLMSDIAEAFIDAMGVKMRGGTKRFQAQYLRLIHVPDPDSISDEISYQLKTAFENNDRKAASKAAVAAYGLE